MFGIDWSTGETYQSTCTTEEAAAVLLFLVVTLEGNLFFFFGNMAVHLCNKELDILFMSILTENGR